MPWVTDDFFLVTIEAAFPEELCGFWLSLGFQAGALSDEAGPSFRVSGRERTWTEAAKEQMHGFGLELGRQMPIRSITVVRSRSYNKLVIARIEYQMSSEIQHGLPFSDIRFIKDDVIQETRVWDKDGTVNTQVNYFRIRPVSA